MTHAIRIKVAAVHGYVGGDTVSVCKGNGYAEGSLVFTSL